ncbi:MAG: hypothetical protein K6T83_14190 [Alicyclobacillus sp.]|nr:hypothetical protein [Alicyclobacillus sp.]
MNPRTAHQEKVQELQRAAELLAQLEADGARISAPWYEFSTPDTEAMRQLEMRLASSAEHLASLSADLDRILKTLQDDGERTRFQEAYHLTQELLQSREASRTLLQTVLSNPNQAHAEYVRAVALKEKAAAEQAAQLASMFRR